MDYLRLVLRELLPAWLVRKTADVDVRPVEQQPPIRDLVGAAPPRRYRGTRGAALLTLIPSWLGFPAIKAHLERARMFWTFEYLPLSAAGCSPRLWSRHVEVHLVDNG
jgi:hypothetical protein